jgi:hypothetical protein
MTVGTVPGLGSAADEFRVAYAYASCGGAAIVRANGQNPISSIKPLNGC